MKGILVLFVLAGFLMPGMVSPDIGKALLKNREKEVVYAEIAVEDIPAAVNEAVQEYFKDYEINKAYQGDEGSFKLEVSREDITLCSFL